MNPTEEDKISTFDVDVKVPTKLFQMLRDNNFNNINGSWNSFISNVKKLKDKDKNKKVEEAEDLTRRRKDKIKLTATSDKNF